MFVLVSVQIHLSIFFFYFLILFGESLVQDQNIDVQFSMDIFDNFSVLSHIQRYFRAGTKKNRCLVYHGNIRFEILNKCFLLTVISYCTL